MGLFCFGSYTRILLSGAPKSVKNKQLCGTLLLALKTSDVIYDVCGDDDKVSKLLGGGQNIPDDVVGVANNIDINQLEHYFENEIVHLLDDNKRRQVILGLKALIKDDIDIDSFTQLGKSVSLTKGELEKKSTFAFTELLANLFLYVVIKTDNTTHKTELKKIGRTYCDKYDVCKDSVSIYELPQIKPVRNIPITILGKKFDNVFTKISAEKLKIKNPSDIQIFRLAIENNEFSYCELQKFLLNNVGAYVYSRLQVQKIKDEDEYGTIALQALSLMNENGSPDEKGTGNELGELLLYIFLEHVLQAPKLMSKVELAGISVRKTSKSDCIHLLTSGGGTPFNQLVFGATTIQDGLQKAIDDAFDHVIEIKSAKNNEYNLVESTAFFQVFDADTVVAARDIIIPKKNNIDKPPMAFGMFLGYAIEISVGEYTHPEYIDAIVKKMEDDITKSADYIYNKIIALGLTGYSFYIYILPFDDAITDKKVIMEKLMTLGGVK